MSSQREGGRTTVAKYGNEQNMSGVLGGQPGGSKLDAVDGREVDGTWPLGKRKVKPRNCREPQ